MGGARPPSACAPAGTFLTLRKFPNRFVRPPTFAGSGCRVPEEVFGAEECRDDARHFRRPVRRQFVAVVALKRARAAEREVAVAVHLVAVPLLLGSRAGAL